MVGFASFVVLFSVLVFVHEFGHFIVAKLSGVRVEEFGFGYPPRLLKLGQWRETTISLNLLPVGGFVRMSEDDPTVEGSLASKSRTARALVHVAGALMNIILAAVLLGVTCVIGTLVPVEGPGAGIYYVAPESPAEMAGLQPGDTIVILNGQTVEDVTQAVEVIRANVGQQLEIVVRRNGRLLPPVFAAPRVDPPENQGALGVSLDLPLSKKSYPIWEAIPMGVRGTFNMIRGIFYGIQAAIRKEIPFEVTGVIGMYSMTTQVAKTGLVRLLEFAAFLSVNFFLFNLLPLPALDGGHLIFVILEWARGGRKVPPEKEGMVHAVGMVVLLCLMAVVSVLDYVRYFG